MRRVAAQTNSVESFSKFSHSLNHLMDFSGVEYASAALSDGGRLVQQSGKPTGARFGLEVWWSLV